MERVEFNRVKLSVKHSSVVALLLLLLKNYKSINFFFFNTGMKQGFFLQVEEIRRSLNATSKRFRGMEAFFEDSFCLDAVLSRKG